MEIRFRCSLHAVCFGILVAIAVVCGSFLLLRAYKVCRFPYPVEASEGICLHMTYLFEDWNLYKGFESYPLVVGNYPPIFFS